MGAGRSSSRGEPGSAGHTGAHGILGRMAIQTPTLLILGARGDLTKRLLIPGLATLLKVERDRRVRVVGADRVETTGAEWEQLVAEAFESAEAPKAVAKPVLDRTSYLEADLLDYEDLSGLIDHCGDGPLVIFFALPPAVSMRVCELLRRIDLPKDTRLALEKPFGTDLESAQRFNAMLREVVPEERLYRIDHFLGVNTVFNLIGLRFANRMLQPIWNREHIERVEIVYDEDLALEGRAGYYDTAGALRDMLQSHLLQILAIFAMESIATVTPEELQDAKAQALRATRVRGGSPKRASRRARYTAGTSRDRRVPDYVAEDGVDPANMTETLAQVTLEIRNNRWAGVPFVVRSGKALAVPRKQIIIYFHDVAHLPTGFIGDSHGDTLVIDLKPGAVHLSLTMNAEGDPLDLEQKTMSATLAAPRMHAYGEVLGEILDGSQLLTVRGDAAEECWRIMEPVLTAWAADRVPMEEYAAGSAGPEGWLHA